MTSRSGQLLVCSELLLNKERLGLEYRVESEPGAGTTFHVYAAKRFVGTEGTDTQEYPTR